MKQLKELIFTAWKKSDERNSMIKMLWYFIGLLFIANLFLANGWSSAVRNQRFFIPPDISHGVLTKANTIPDSTVYAFAFQIFSAINSWTQSGSQDYKNNIINYQNYLSPQFRQALLTDVKTRDANGALDRQRSISAVSGMGYLPSDVKNMGNGTWQVTLKLRLMETVNNAVVKDVIIDYSLLVATNTESVVVNPWGLSIVGFSANPYRLKTLDQDESNA